MISPKLQKQLIMLAIVVMAIAAALVPLYADRIALLPNMFNNNWNMLLLAVAVLCVTLVDIRMGVAMAFLVLMLAVYVRTRRAKELFRDYSEELAATSAPVNQHTAVLTANEINENEMKYAEASKPPMHPHVDHNGGGSSQEGFESHIGMESINLGPTHSAADFVAKEYDSKERLADMGAQPGQIGSDQGCILQGMPRVENAGHMEMGTPLAASKTYQVDHQMKTMGTLFYPLHPPSGM